MLRKIAATFLLTLVISNTASASTILLPRTGQTICYNATGDVIDCAGAGQDGSFLAGKAWSSPRFVENPDGTVTDNLTGLIWLKNANCTETVGGVVKSAGTLTWTNALVWSNNLASGACGLTDNSVAGQWRLPNLNELASLMDASRDNPALPAGHRFVGVQADVYWTSSTSANDTSLAWFFDLSDGYLNHVSKSYGAYVLPVRGGL